jgi:hypothetical protein
MILCLLEGIMTQKVRDHHLRVSDILAESEVDGDIETGVAIPIRRPEGTTVPGSFI